MKDKTERKNRIIFILIAASVIILPFIAITLGRYPVTLHEFLMALFPFFFHGEQITKITANVIFNIRLPRIILAITAGAGLSVAGASFQALFSNPLATPDTLGVATGASFGAVLGILFGFPSWGIQLCALGTGIASVLLVYSVSSINGKNSIIMIVLAGMVISALFSACVSLVKYIADPQDVLPAITFWLMGSLSGTTRNVLFQGLPFIFTGMLIIFLLRWKLNLLTLSEDEATSLGIPVKKYRAIIIFASTMITASVVSMCGLIGWVGLLIPHVSRMIFGNNNKLIIPSSMGLGAVFLLIIDTTARCAAQSEIPVSILTAIIGAPFFIVLLRKTGGIKA